MNIQFPFAAIVGQDNLKMALMLCAICPEIGGVLVRGEKGTAKSTASRGLAEVVSPIQCMKDCCFNCLPGQPAGICQECNKPDACLVNIPVPFINLPLAATEDRVLGSLDFERALKEGKKAFQPGLLASAHRGILYIDEVNLLADHLVDVLLDAAAMGVNILQREGLSVEHPARFTLIGTMNPEEGDLRPQLLDRFGMMVDVSAPSDPLLRAEVVRRRISFEKSPESFRQEWFDAQALLQAKIAYAKELLSQVTLSESLLSFISNLCCQLEIKSLRADIVMHKVSRAAAALNGRTAVNIEDIRLAAELALPHRKRQRPGEQSGLNSEQLDDLMQNLSKEQQKQLLDKPEQNFLPDNNSAMEKGASDEQNNEHDERQVFAVQKKDLGVKLEVKGELGTENSGRRSTISNTKSGQYVRAVLDERPSSLALDATIRHSVIRNFGKLNVEKQDFHQKLKAGKTGNLILFVVDSSGSMGAVKRMESVKGAIVALLDDAYQRRDEVGLIAFGGAVAEVVLPPTRSIDLSQKHLKELPTGGRTPLAHALLLTLSCLAKVRKDLEPLVVLLSDGRANVSTATGLDPWHEAITYASEIARGAYASLVVDTESGYMRFARAQELAKAMAAEYLCLDDLNVDNLTLCIRGRLRR